MAARGCSSCFLRLSAIQGFGSQFRVMESSQIYHMVPPFRLFLGSVFKMVGASLYYKYNQLVMMTCSG
jgi:hypothetical protein